MKQAGRTRIMRRPKREGRPNKQAKRAGKAAPAFVVQNWDEIEPVKPVVRPK